MERSVRRRVFAVIIWIGFILCACSEKEVPVSLTLPEEENQEIFVITEQDQKLSEENCEKIDLDDCDGELRITEGGDYYLYGCLEGKLVVDAYEDETVHLYLADVEITSPAGPAVNVVSASKLIMTLVSDTENILTDTADYKGYEDTEGCLYSVADLTINGDGLLYVYGYYEDGIRSKDVIKILGSRIDVQAKADGIRGNDGIMVKDVQLKVQSERNGLRTTKQGTDTKGTVEISGGSLEIISGGSGIYAAADLYMRNCSCRINSVEEKMRVEGTDYIGEGCID